MTELQGWAIIILLLVILWAIEQAVKSLDEVARHLRAQDWREQMRQED